MKPILTFLTLFLMLGGVASAETVKLLCTSENTDPLVFHVDYKNSKLKQGSGGWGDMYYNDSNIYTINIDKKNKNDPDIGVLVYSKKINRLTGQFTFAPAFLNENQYKIFLKDVFNKNKELAIDYKNSKTIKVFSDEISLRADKKNIRTGKCNKKNKIENKF
jgi:hypothetical protein